MYYLIILSVAVVIFQSVLSINVKRLEGNYQDISPGNKKDPIVVEVSLNPKPIRYKEVDYSPHSSGPRELLQDSKSAASIYRTLKVLMDNYRRMQISAKMEYVKEEGEPETSTSRVLESSKNKKQILRTGTDGKPLRIENHLKAQMPNFEALTNVINVLASEGAENGLKKLMGIHQNSGTKATNQSNDVKTRSKYPKGQYTEKQYREYYNSLKKDPKLFAQYKTFRFLVKMAGVTHRPLDLFMDIHEFYDSMETTDEETDSEEETDDEENNETSAEEEQR